MKIKTYVAAVEWHTPSTGKSTIMLRLIKAVSADEALGKALTYRLENQRLGTYNIIALDVLEQRFKNENGG